MTIKELAKIVGVSDGTIDRVIHNRGRVSSDTRDKVLKAIEKYNYVPNTNGRALAQIAKSNKLGIVLPYYSAFSQSLAFTQALLDGLCSEYAKLINCGTKIKEVLLENDNEAYILEELKALDKWGINILILQIIDTPQIKKYINYLVEKGVFVITLNTDIPNSNRNCYVGWDNYSAGKTAIRMLEIFLNNRGKIAVFTGRLQQSAHKKRLEGITDYLQNKKSDLDLIDVFELRSKNIKDLDKYFYNIEELDGIIITSIYSYAVIEALKSKYKNLSDRIKIGVFDCTPDNVRFMNDSDVCFIIEQHPYLQGKKAIETVLNFLELNDGTNKEIWNADISIILPENNPIRKN